MQTLYHLWLSPFCRKVRIVLHEKKIDVNLQVENVWERRKEFLALNPAGSVPVLLEPGGPALSGSNVISEFLDEIHPEPPLIGRHPLERAEVRRIVDWFDDKFNKEVTENLVGEKVMKRFLGLGAPDSKAIRAGHSNISTHLSYISYLVERRKWLAGNELTLADITAAAHLSAIDYLGDVPWDDYPSAKEWYVRIKSRPSFRPLLSDYIPGAPPSKHYANLDF
ncbi:MAG: glutathione S-transferase [Magnetovibrio sp.]|nr:glutathione S-transferase [Magnetovibrio sp.]|tara:strand:+ start:1980 stop:2648 length:669 start_codon:yes stop_codon:yes gene_type:complete